MFLHLFVRLKGSINKFSGRGGMVLRPVLSHVFSFREGSAEEGEGLDTDL